jgi:hypothetical protein
MISLKNGNGSILNMIINSNYNITMFNNSFIDCSARDSKSQGGSLYLHLKKGGRLIIGDSDDITSCNIFENCTAPNNDDEDGRGGAIAIYIDEETTEAKMKLCSMSEFFFFY